MDENNMPVFRAWIPSVKKMCVVKELLLTVKGALCFGESWRFYGREDPRGNCVLLQRVCPLPSQIQDENPKQWVYEGDIVRRVFIGDDFGDDDKRGVIVRYFGGWALKVDMGADFGPFFDTHWYNAEYVQVLGNIYENPDLV